MKNYSLRKKSAFVSIFLIGLLWSVTVLANSYSTTFSFDTHVQGQSRYFDGQNIAFEATAIPSFRHTVNTTYTVELHRDKGPFQGNDLIGKVTLLRNAWDKAEWSNVGPGNYYLYFSKEFDGVVLKSNNAKIYNY